MEVGSEEQGLLTQAAAQAASPIDAPVVHSPPPVPVLNVFPEAAHDEAALPLEERLQKLHFYIYSLDERIFSEASVRIKLMQCYGATAELVKEQLGSTLGYQGRCCVLPVRVLVISGIPVGHVERALKCRRSLEVLVLTSAQLHERVRSTHFKCF
jgi:hypothetical protein